MPKLAHLLDDKPQAPVYQLDFGDRVTATVAQVIAQESVNRLIPTFESLLNQMVDGVQRIEAGSEGATAKVEAAASALDAAVRDEIKNVQADLKKAVKALTDAQKRDSGALTDRLVNALGAIEIPDYSKQLAQIAAAQSLTLSALQEEDEDDDPKEWNFTVNRNSSGFIQSVTAKAK